MAWDVKTPSSHDYFVWFQRKFLLWVRQGWVLYHSLCFCLILSWDILSRLCKIWNLKPPLEPETCTSPADNSTTMIACITSKNPFWWTFCKNFCTYWLWWKFVFSMVFFVNSLTNVVNDRSGVLLELIVFKYYISTLISERRIANEGICDARTPSWMTDRQWPNRLEIFSLLRKQRNLVQERKNGALGSKDQKTGWREMKSEWED